MFVKADKVKGKLQVIYERDDGSKVSYSGGDLRTACTSKYGICLLEVGEM